MGSQNKLRRQKTGPWSLGETRAKGCVEAGQGEGQVPGCHQGTEHLICNYFKAI